MAAFYMIGEAPSFLYSVLLLNWHGFPCDL